MNWKIINEAFGGGAVGYLDFYRKFRYLYRNPFAPRKWEGISWSGAGIVADSIPEKEFQECINKAKAVVEAIKKHSRWQFIRKGER